jgi:hypothetical protein
MKIKEYPYGIYDAQLVMTRHYEARKYPYYTDWKLAHRKGFVAGLYCKIKIRPAAKKRIDRLQRYIKRVRL